MKAFQYDFLQEEFPSKSIWDLTPIKYTLSPFSLHQSFRSWLINGLMHSQYRNANEVQWILQDAEQEEEREADDRKLLILLFYCNVGVIFCFDFIWLFFYGFAERRPFLPSSSFPLIWNKKCLQVFVLCYPATSVFNAATVTTTESHQKQREKKPPAFLNVHITSWKRALMSQPRWLKLRSKPAS